MTMRYGQSATARRRHLPYIPKNRCLIAADGAAWFFPSAHVKACALGKHKVLLTTLRARFSCAYGLRSIALSKERHNFFKCALKTFAFSFLWLKVLNCFLFPSPYRGGARGRVC